MLEDMNLAKYQQVFAREHIDGSMFLELDEVMLKGRRLPSLQPSLRA